MYRLYKNNGNGWEELIRSRLEKDIVDTLEYEHKNNKEAMYGIIRDIGNGDEPYKFIRKEQDYIDYMKNYTYKMINELSVIELKKQIIEIKEAKKK